MIFFAWLFLILGVIIMLASGICTMVFGSSVGWEEVLIFGGIPFALGIGSYALGHWLKKRSALAATSKVDLEQ